jgi:serine/threonine-protein kinase
VALDISVVGETPPRSNKKLLIALAFIAFVGVGFAVVLLATRPSGGAARADAKPVPVVPKAGTGTGGEKAGAETAAASTPDAAQVHFHVTSEPTGAHVWLGRKELGVTPLVFSVPAGPDGTVTKEIVFTLDGYYPLNVVAGGSHDVVLMQNMQKRPRARVSSRVEERAPTLEAPTLVSPEPVPNPPPGISPAVPGANGTAVVPAVGTSNLAQVAPVKLATPKPPAVTVLPFGDGMSPPALESEGSPIRYTREALAAKVEGVMIAKCLISTTGAVQNCRVIKPVPLMQQSVLDSLTSRKYSPITYQGHPVAVDYVFTIRLVLPHH